MQCIELNLTIALLRVVTTMGSCLMSQAGFESGTSSIQHLKISPGSPAVLQFVVLHMAISVICWLSEKTHPKLDAECYWIVEVQVVRVSPMLSQGVVLSIQFDQDGIVKNERTTLLEAQRFQISLVLTSGCYHPCILTASSWLATNLDVRLAIHGFQDTLLCHISTTMTHHIATVRFDWK